MNKKLVYLYIAIAGVTATVLNLSNTIMADSYDVIYGNLAYYAVTVIASFITYFLLKENNTLAKYGSLKNLFGGPLGAFVPIFVALGFINLGAFLTTMLLITGQFLTSFIIDVKGKFDLPKMKMNKMKWFSVVLIIIGTVVMSL
ncbi:MAG TPA: DMT family transporter [Anaerovoracaceae bacterium]|nr:DMT family transporter [Anaerovoracaceae bacterium]